MIPVDDRLRLRAFAGRAHPLPVPAPPGPDPVGSPAIHPRGTAPGRLVVDGLPPVAAQPRIAVVDGPGGLARAVALAADGLEVLVVGDRADEQAVPGLAAATTSGRLRWTRSFEDAIAFADVHFVTAGGASVDGETPVGGSAATATALRSAVLGLVARATRRTLVVGCPPVPVGTAAELATVVRNAAPVLSGVELAWVPDAGVLDRAGRADGLTFGVGSRWAEAQLRAVFRRRLDAGTPVVVTDLETIELAAAVGWRAFRDGTNALRRND